MRSFGESLNRAGLNLREWNVVFSSISDDSGAEFVEVIHVDEETEARMALQPKKTLHERFTGL